MKYTKIRIYGLLSTLLFLFAGQKCIGQEIVPNNLTILSKLIQQAVNDVVEQINIDQVNRIILLIPESNHAADWLIEKGLIDVFNQKGISDIYIKPRGVPVNIDNTERAFIISYRPIKVSIAYSSKKNKESKNHDVLERTATIEIYIQVINKDEKLILSETVRKVNLDRIKKEQKSSVENAHYPFTSGGSIESSFISQFIEPVVGICVSGAILYMFYTFRSK